MTSHPGDAGAGPEAEAVDDERGGSGEGAEATGTEEGGPQARQEAPRPGSGEQHCRQGRLFLCYFFISKIACQLA